MRAFGRPDGLGPGARPRAAVGPARRGAALLGSPGGAQQSAARRGDTVLQVNILPPAYLWAGDMRLDELKPDATHWKIYADGELIGRIEREEDVGAALVPLLLTCR